MCRTLSDVTGLATSVVRTNLAVEDENWIGPKPRPVAEWAVTAVLQTSNGSSSAQACKLGQSWQSIRANRRGHTATPAFGPATPQTSCPEIDPSIGSILDSIFIFWLNDKRMTPPAVSFGELSDSLPRFLHSKQTVGTQVALFDASHVLQVSVCMTDAKHRRR